MSGAQSWAIRPDKHHAVSVRVFLSIILSLLIIAWKGSYFSLKNLCLYLLGMPCAGGGVNASAFYDHLYGPLS